MNVKEWILIIALVVYLSIVIPTLIDTRKTFKRIENHYSGIKGTKKK
ncbi:MAG: hypothetical protein ACLRHZ_06910 [Enterococcus avium]